MNISKVWAVSFSPTRTSRKVVEAIASVISNDKFASLDLTYSATAVDKTFVSDELVVIGVPVYAGRVAPLAAQRLQGLQGDNSPAILVVVYGNREYDDALVELKDIVVKGNFLPVAAAAFIGEHSFSTPAMPIGQGRPDGEDLAAAGSFAETVAEKIAALPDISQAAELVVPGNCPYRDGMAALSVTPKVDMEACSLCGLCVETCPGDAIVLEDTVIMDPGRCIFCCACIKNCPEKAVAIEAVKMLEIRQWLHENCQKRKEPELYY